MAQQRALPQSKETLLQSYNKRLKDDVKSIMDNFTEIIKTAKIEDETQVSRATQGEQDNYEMHVRAANICTTTVKVSAVVPPDGQGNGGGAAAASSARLPWF